MQNFNIDSKGVNKLTEENMDAYLESLQQRERDKYKEDNINFLQNNEAFLGLKAL